MFKVTEKAMRPASRERRCFYCNQPVGSMHKDDCVLISKKVKMRMIVEYDVLVPSTWTKEQIEFHRNDSSWCASNVISELEELDKEDRCLCGIARFEYLGEDDKLLLNEK